MARFALKVEYDGQPFAGWQRQAAVPSVQEAVDLMILAFDLAEQYRNPVMVCADGMIGQMMEPVEFPGEGRGEPLKENDWALTGCEGRKRRIVNSLYLAPEELHGHNIKLKEKYDRIEANEKRWELYDDGDVKVRVMDVSGWPLESGMAVHIVGGPSRPDHDFIQFHKRADDDHGQPQIFVLYANGYARIITQPPVGREERVCFGASMKSFPTYPNSLP